MTFQHEQRLSHLGEAEISALTDRYYAGERTTALIDEFKIVCSPSHLHRLLPPRLLHDRSCAACGALLVEMPQSRGRRQLWGAVIRCLECDHRQEASCRCGFCHGLRLNQLRAMETRCRAAIEGLCRSNWKYDEVRRQPQDLELIEAVALLALVRCGGWLTSSTVGAIADSAVPLVPQGRWGERLWSPLVAAGLVAPALDSPISAFPSRAGSLDIDLDRVHWKILTPSPMSFVRQLERIGETGDWAQSFRESVSEVRVALALAECSEFADFCLEERGLPGAGNAASEALYMNLFSDFSVAQCFRIIWAGVHATSDFMARKQVSRQHATNYFIGACQRWADRTRSEGWLVKDGFRNFKRPRSQVSYVLYDVFVGIGEKGFTSPLGVMSS